MAEPMIRHGGQWVPYLSIIPERSPVRVDLDCAYGCVLADLYRLRSEIDITIRVLERMRGTLHGVPVTSSFSDCG
jgi:hypothetical protein